MQISSNIDTANELTIKLYRHYIEIQKLRKTKA